MDTTHLPTGILLNNIDFIPWKARIDAALQALGLPYGRDARPDTTSEREWQAASAVAASTIRSFVPAELLKQVPVSHYYHHAKLMITLQNLTLRFRCMDLPGEIRKRVYSHLQVASYSALKKEELSGTKRSRAHPKNFVQRCCLLLRAINRLDPP